MDIPNIEAVYEHGISEADARYLAMNDIKIVENELVRVHECVEDLDGVRQLILMDMAFNMGVPRLCKFKKMWNAIHEGNYEVASLEMMDSRWARQVGRRAKKLSDAMKAGILMSQRNRDKIKVCSTAKMVAVSLRSRKLSQLKPVSS